MMSQMQHISTRDKASQESFLHTTRKEQSANAAPLAALDDSSRGGRGRGGGGGRGTGSYATRQNRHRNR
eukprot:946268-Pleurochrysis_carterae.AAC.1